MIIFTVKIRDNKIIRLTTKQWKNIVYRHPEISNKLSEMENTLTFPDYKKEENNITKYYKYIKEEDKYMMVACKLLNGDGFVITGYITRKIQK